MQVVSTVRQDEGLPDCEVDLLYKTVNEKVKAGESLQVSHTSKGQKIIPSGFHYFVLLFVVIIYFQL